MAPVVTDVLSENVAGASVEIQDGAESVVVNCARVSEHFGEQVEIEGAIILNSLDSLSHDAREALKNDGQSLYDSDSERSASCGDNIEVASQRRSTSKPNESYYTVEQMSHFLDSKKINGDQNLMYFPNLRLFNGSCAIAMREATLEELYQPKRY